MSEKHKSKDKDKDKKRRDSAPDEKEAKRVKTSEPAVEADKDTQPKAKEPEKKEKKEKDKDKKKDKDKDKKDKKEKDNEKATTSEQAGPSASPPATSSKAEEKPAEKKLKKWQDDALELESDEEQDAKASSADGSKPRQAKSAWDQEADPLDQYMADITIQDHGAQGSSALASADTPEEGAATPEATDAGGQVKSITLDEIEKMMRRGRRDDAEEPASSTGDKALKEPADKDPSSGSAPASAALGGSDTKPEGEAEETKDPADDEDEKFHRAFMAQMRKLRGEDEDNTVARLEKDFAAAITFTGPRPGFVFKKDRLGLGYYRDIGLAAILENKATAKAKLTSGVKDPAGSWEGDFRRAPKKAKKDLDDDEGAGGNEGAGEEDDDDGDGDEDDAVEESKPGSSKEAEAGEESAPGKVVESKKDKRRKRREAKEAEAKAIALAAKQKAKGEFGDRDFELMESDPEGSEQSTEEEPESYFDLVKRFTTKKQLPAVDHDRIEYMPFRKNLYVQVKEITNMKDHEVEDLRRTHGEIKIRGKHCPHPIKSFLQCGLPDRCLKIMEKRDYEKPFPIQMQAIPGLMCGRDLIGVATTGSGKTLAYLLPMIRHILDQPKIKDGDGPIGFVIAPTRELALQIQREANVFCKACNLTSVCAYGGGPMGEQLSALKKGAELLVGTPGRLIDVLTTSNGKITNLRRVTFMVLDEADRMFDMGFEPQIGMFLQSTRPDKQVAMFSATLPTHVEALARKVLKKPIEITVGERNTAATNVTQFVEVLDETQKFYRLLQLLGEWQEHGSIIIFVHQQKDVDEMFTELLKYGYPPLALHGGQDQQDRDFTLQDFKDNVSNILIATSVAARGIDVKSVILVVNFKVPDHLEDYIHRIGRTGRAGKPGFAYTFVQPDEGDRAQDMVDALRQCNQEVPQKLKQLAEEHQTAVNTGQAQKRKRWGGFGGKGYKFDNTEKSRLQKDRTAMKRDMLIGDKDEREEEEEEFKDSWLEDKPAGKGGGKGKGKDEKKSEADPGNTLAAAQQVAARMQGASAAKEPVAAAADVAAGSSPGGSLSGAKPPPAPPKEKVAPRKTDKEIEDQAEKMADDTLKSLPDEVREKQLPALKQKLIVKLKKAEQDRINAAAGGPVAAPAPPPEEVVPEPTPVMKAFQAIPLVPGVLGQGFVPAKSNMVTRAIDSLQANSAAPGQGTAHLAEEKAAMLSGPHGVVPAGCFGDELEINDYPTVARQKISHRDPLVSIEEMTGAKVQVKGQHFLPGAKMPEGAKKLYVEIVGPTTIAVAKAKHEVHKMMEALAIRTLNIPGLKNAMGGGRYDPATGK